MAVFDVKRSLENLEILTSKLLSSKDEKERRESIVEIESNLDKIKTLPEYYKMVDFIESIEKLIGIYQNETDNEDSIIRILSIVSDEIRNLRHKFALFSEPDEEIY